MAQMIAAAISTLDSSCHCFSLLDWQDDDMSSIGQRVATLRAARRLSQQALATEVGVSQPTIANIERGRTTEIKGYVLEALAHALNTTPKYILEGEGEHAQGTADDAATQAELVGVWKKLPQSHKDTLLQTARGLLRAAEVSPPTVVLPTRRAGVTRAKQHA